MQNEKTLVEDNPLKVLRELYRFLKKMRSCSLCVLDVDSCHIKEWKRLEERMEKQVRNSPN